MQDGLKPPALRIARNDLSLHHGAEWHLMASDLALLKGRRGFGLVGVASSIILLGGQIRSTSNSDHPPDDALLSDDGGITWQVVCPECPWGPRRGFSAVSYGGILILLGGRKYLNGQRQSNFWPFLADIWISPDLGKSWLCIVPHAPWPGRENFGAVVMKFTLFVLGGSGMNSALNDVWSADMSDLDTWSCLHEAAPWDIRSRFACTSFNGKLFIFGGITSNDALPGVDANMKSDIWSMDLSGNWEQCCHHTPWQPRCDMAAVSIADGCLLLGGRVERSVRASLNRSDAWWSRDNSRWSLVCQHSDQKISLKRHHDVLVQCVETHALREQLGSSSTQWRQYPNPGRARPSSRTYFAPVKAIVLGASVFVVKGDGEVWRSVRIIHNHQLQLLLLVGWRLRSKIPPSVWKKRV